MDLINGATVWRVGHRPSVDSEDTRGAPRGEVAGILFIAAAIGVASEPAVRRSVATEAEALAMTALGCASGALCLIAPWERLSRRGLHLVTAIATIEVALVAGLADHVYSFFFPLVAVYAGYALHDAARCRAAGAADLCRAARAARLRAAARRTRR